MSDCKQSQLFVEVRITSLKKSEIKKKIMLACCAELWKGGAHKGGSWLTKLWEWGRKSRAHLFVYLTPRVWHGAPTTNFYSSFFSPIFFLVQEILPQSRGSLLSRFLFSFVTKCLWSSLHNLPFPSIYLSKPLQLWWSF